MAKKEKQETQEAEEKPSGNRKMMILIVVSALLLVGISVSVTFFLLAGNDESAVAVEDEEPEKGDPLYYKLDPFTVNLDPQDPVGFLQIQIQVLTYSEEVAAELEKHTPLIRNNVTVLFGQQKSTELRSPEGKQALQKKVHELIQQTINKYGSGGEVANVFFTSFVMQ